MIKEGYCDLCSQLYEKLKTGRDVCHMHVIYVHFVTHVFFEFCSSLLAGNLVFRGFLHFSDMHAQITTLTKSSFFDAVLPLSVHKSLDNLPFDVLHEISRSFGPQAEIPRCYRVITSLGRVNRRLRTFALPFILREVSVSTAKQLSRSLHFFADSPPEYSSFVRYRWQYRMHICLRV